ncbi:MAG: hypothetical protein K2X29_01510 [Candidatus Obscuribacterales bacterium]|nr:hypothetical protein [Candidatus Obscuribacterales bacterium]
MSIMVTACRWVPWSGHTYIQKPAFMEAIKETNYSSALTAELQQEFDVTKTSKFTKHEMTAENQHRGTIGTQQTKLKHTQRNCYDQRIGSYKSHSRGKVKLIYRDRTNKASGINDADMNIPNRGKDKKSNAIRKKKTEGRDYASSGACRSLQL